MKILATIDKSKDGNDCFVNQEYILASFAGTTRLLRFTEYSDEKILYVLSYSSEEVEEDHVLKNIYEELNNIHLSGIHP